MDRDCFEELHYITHIDNIPSIISHGILSYDKAQKLKPNSVAMVSIQDIREKVIVPNGLPLHNYANLYFHARNPMLYRLKNRHHELAVLSVNNSVLDLPNVVITDGNASSTHIRFYPSPDGISKLDKSLVFAEYWTDDNIIEYWRKKSARCAEVLVPEKIGTEFVQGIYVSCDRAKKEADKINSGLFCKIDSHLFFV